MPFPTLLLIFEGVPSIGHDRERLFSKYRPANNHCLFLDDLCKNESLYLIISCDLQAMLAT